MFIQSLQHRICAMQALWERALEDMTLDQINHHERSGVLPIAFSLSHTVRTQDRAIRYWMLDQPTIWEEGAWARRIGATVDRQGTGETVEEMEHLRIGDLAAWKAYQAAVFAATDAVLTTVDDATLAEVVIRAVPTGAEGFWALLVGAGNPMRKLDVLECWVYQHGLRHLGELEHARALVGLGGLSG